MPKYKTHLIGGFVTFILIAFIFIYILKQKDIIEITFSRGIIFLLFCLFGSLFPDIDTKSKVQKYIYYPLFIVIIIAILIKNWLLLSLVSILAFIPILANHRKLTHKVWFLIFIPLLPFIFIAKLNKIHQKELFLFYIFFVAGAFSHIFLDFGPSRFLGIKRKKIKK
ncbi:hypothetical protein GF322_03855 [Candidatus Dependentiae bacterium]|nr:hypothetical protein [Candidatus Dependentiae bacterium]